MSDTHSTTAKRFQNMEVILFRGYEWAGQTFCRIATDEPFASSKPRLLQSLQAPPDCDVRYALVQHVNASKSPVTNLSGISPSHVATRLSHPLDDDKTARFYGLTEDVHCLVVVDPLNQDYDGGDSFFINWYSFAQPLVQLINVTLKCRYFSETGQRSVAQFDFDCRPETTIGDLRKQAWEMLSKSHVSKYLLAEDKYWLVTKCPKVADTKGPAITANQVILQRVQNQDRPVSDLLDLGRDRLAMALIINPDTTVECHFSSGISPLTVKVSQKASELYELVAAHFLHAATGTSREYDFVLEAIPVNAVPQRDEDGNIKSGKIRIPNSDDMLCTLDIIRDCYILVTPKQDVEDAPRPSRGNDNIDATILKRMSGNDKIFIESRSAPVIPSSLPNIHFACKNIPNCPEGTTRAPAKWPGLCETSTQEEEARSRVHLRFCIDEATRKISLLTDIRELTDCINKYTKVAERIRDGLNGSTLAVIASINNVAPTIVFHWRRGHLPSGVLLTLDEQATDRVEKELADVKEEAKLLENIERYKETQQALEVLERKITEDAKTLKINTDQWMDKTSLTPEWATALFGENGLKKLEEQHPSKVLPDIWWDVLVDQAPAREQLRVYAKLRANGWSVPRIDNA
jgi:hypothetical protein